MSRLREGKCATCRARDAIPYAPYADMRCPMQKLRDETGMEGRIVHCSEFRERKNERERGGRGWTS